MARPKKAEAQADQAEQVALVRMTKDGETLEVNPLCVADHKRLGWQVADPAQNQE